MKEILKKPLISEKSFADAALGKFSFVVAKSATKEDIASIVKELYQVDVIDVNTANYKGKVKSTKRGKGKRSDFKKAIITLKSGQKISLFETEEKKEEKKPKKEEKK